MFIGELSKKTGVPIKTIRYYEEFGLLHKAKRSASKYRVYNQDDLEKLLFIKKSKALGLSLAEIKSIIRRSGQGVESTCSLVHEVFEKKIAECERRIKELKETKRQLGERLHHWIKPNEAKKLKFAICPQIESNDDKGQCYCRDKRGT